MKKYLFVLLLISVPISIYYQGFYNDFLQWDDNSQVYENEEVLHFSFRNLKVIYTTCVSGMYQPLTTLFFAIINMFFGVKSTLPFHVFSFVLHLLNTLLVYRLGEKLFKNGTKAFFLAMLFSVQHMSVEVVSWISATSTLLFTSFYLLSLLFYIKYLETKNVKNYIISATFFLIGCFCKVQIIPLIGVLFLVDFLYDKPVFSKNSILLKLPFFVVAILFAIIAIYFRQVTLISNAENSPMNSVYFGLNQFMGYLFELISLPHYDLIRQLDVVIHLHVVLFIVLIFVVYRFRQNKLFTFGVFFFLMNLILQTTLFSKFNNPYSNRYVYIAGTGIWIAMLSFNYKKKQLYIISFYIILQIIFAKAVAVNWSNASAMYRYDKVLVSDAKMARLNDFGKYQLEDLILKETKNSYELKGFNALGIYNNMGVVFARFGLLDASEICFLKAIEITTGDLDIYINLALVFDGKDDLRYEKHLLNAHSAKPNTYELRIKLGNFYAQTDIEKAARYYKDAFAQKPKLSIAPMNLTVIYSKKNREKAEIYFLKALSLNPNSTLIFENLSVFYESSDPVKSKQYRERAEALYFKENW